MDWKLEVVVVPVSDVDRAKHFYAEQVGFQVDVDRQCGSRVVHTRDARSATADRRQDRVKVRPQRIKKP